MANTAHIVDFQQFRRARRPEPPPAVAAPALVWVPVWVMLPMWRLP